MKTDILIFQEIIRCKNVELKLENNFNNHHHNLPTTGVITG